MGYAVGNLCYDNRQQAEDVYYSKVVPYVDGKALYPPSAWLVFPRYQAASRLTFLRPCTEF